MEWVEVYGVVKILATNGPNDYYRVDSLHVDELAALNSARSLMRQLFVDLGKGGGGFASVEPEDSHTLQEYRYRQGDKLHRVQIVEFWVPRTLWVLLEKRLLDGGGHIV